MANAYNDLLSKNEFRVSIKELADIVKLDRRNIKSLKDDVRALLGCVVEWDLLDKTGDWEAYSMLSGAAIINGKILQYSYDPGLKMKLYNPETYAKISLAMQMQFSSKYALILYELCVSFFVARIMRGETPWISLEDYRKLMGVDGEKIYDEFKYINQRLIQSPLKEINRKTDLSVKVKFRRFGTGNRISEIKFTITPNEKSDALIEKLSSIQKQSGESGLPLGGDDRGEVRMRLAAHGLKEHQINSILSRYDDEYLSENLDVVDIKIRANKLSPQGVPGYTWKAIQEDFRPPKGLAESLANIKGSGSKTAEAEETKKRIDKENRLAEYKTAIAMQYLGSLEDGQRHQIAMDVVAGMDLPTRNMLSLSEAMVNQETLYNDLMQRPSAKFMLVDFVVKSFLAVDILPMAEARGFTALF